MFDESLLTKEPYKTAFTHRSFLNESDETKESNERLEFLGDVVLSFIVSAYLYQQRPADNEGDLTNLRSYMVKTGSLARASKKLRLGDYLRLSKGEEQSGGRNNEQLLANVYEALLGAMFLDKGIEGASKFIHLSLFPLFADEIRDGPPKDSKSLLQEIAQNQTKQSPKYKIMETWGPDHAKEFKVGVFLQGKPIGEGMGLSKQIAEEAAATQGLQYLSKQGSD